MTISNPVTYSKRNGTGVPVTGTFIDFTGLCNKYKFKDIRPHSDFKRGGNMMGAVS